MFGQMSGENPNSGAKPEKSEKSSKKKIGPKTGPLIEICQRSTRTNSGR
jgi:hypothetical protein